jgi:isocitrate dehydrogenase
VNHSTKTLHPASPTAGPAILAQPAPLRTAITVAHGDGIGPEIMAATLHILREAGARLDIDTIEIGEKVYAQGHSAGIKPAAWESLRGTGVFLKAPITTPQGGGVKSLNVTVRKALGLFANVRPAVAYAPFVATRHPGMNLVIVRENEEDLYAGIEHRQSADVHQCLKIITRSGCERIVRYAFDYARLHGRKRVTCFTKDNIMKLTDGLFHRVFDEIGRDYPELEQEHWIVDIGAAKLADTPHVFDVIVMPNLYGDILSDVAAQIAGSVGLAGSANIGERCAMFEAIHGSAPRRAGQNLANPSGLLRGAIMMLDHLGQTAVAARVHNAWLRTLEDGVHTYDLCREGVTRQKVGTREFAAAVVERLGLEPLHLPVIQPAHGAVVPVRSATRPAVRVQKKLVGVDVFIDEAGIAPAELARRLQPLRSGPLELEMISNRGMQVWPNGLPETTCTDVFRCRFRVLDSAAAAGLSHDPITRLLHSIATDGFDWAKTELLYEFDGQPGFTRSQGG